MTKYLLDTNHLSAYLSRRGGLASRIDAGLRQGDRFGITLPVLCEYRAGIAIGKHAQRNTQRLNSALAVMRVWPVDGQTAVEFASVFSELCQKGRALAQFDCLIAAVARQFDLTLLTADNDFAVVERLKVENWLFPTP